MDVHDTIATLGEGGVVGDEDQGGPAVLSCIRGLACQAEQQFDDPRAGFGIQVSGGLVREQNRGFVHDCTGDRHALLLAARELMRVMPGSGRQADTVQGIAGAGREFRAGTGIMCGVEFEGQQYVLECGQGGQKLERLEDESDAPGTQRGTPVFIQFRDILPQQANFSGTWGVQTCKKAEQCGLSGAGSTENRHGLTATDLEIDAAQDFQGSARADDILFQASGLQDGGRDCIHVSFPDYGGAGVAMECFGRQ